MEIRPFGDRALLVELPDRHRRRDLADQVRDGGEGIVTEVVEGALTVLVRVARPEHLPTLVGLVRGLTPRCDAEAEPPRTDIVHVPVRYDGPDLDDVCRAARLTRAELIGVHTRLEWVVDFAGFLPGFAYLVPVDPIRAWPEVPRRSTPRTHVPPGSLALAGTWSGIYPSASPGGWQLIGRTDLRLWDPGREAPALLTPGRRLRFEALP